MITKPPGGTLATLETIVPVVERKKSSFENPDFGDLLFRGADFILRRSIRTYKSQNFRNGSKSALRKSKIYIYEHILGKFPKIPEIYIYEHLYIRTYITVPRGQNFQKFDLQPEHFLNSKSDYFAILKCSGIYTEIISIDRK